MADIVGIRYHHIEVLFQNAAELVLPFRIVRLRGRHRDAGVGHLQWQDIEAFRVGVGHHLGNAGDFDLQRVDAGIRQADTVGEPFRQHFQ